MSRFLRLLLIPVLGVGLLLAGVIPTVASSHREAPLISQDPVADDTDVYAFVSPDKPDTVTLIGNWIPLEEPAGGPNFYKFGQDVRYTFKIDNNGAAVPTLDKDGGAKVFAGQRDDPFFVDLGSVFDLAGLRPLNQAHALKLDKANGVDGVSGYNVHSIALQVPISRLTANGKAPTG